LLNAIGDDSFVLREKQVVLLSGVLVCLVAIMALSPMGVFGFMHSVEETNLVSIAILASLIGVIFVLLHRAGLSFGYVEEVSPRA
jgi:hypothetical protein